MTSSEERGVASGVEAHLEPSAAEPISTSLEPDQADVLPSDQGGWLSTDRSHHLNEWRARPLKNISTSKLYLS